MTNDKLVKAVFEALKQETASPEDRRIAICRAGQIAQAYMGANDELLESVFGLGPNRLLDDHVERGFRI